MNWLYFLAGLFVGNLAAFVAIALAQSIRRGEEAMAAHEAFFPANDSAR
ncbi:MAG: hypothetical protein MUC41_09995 [Syntrophobacteraceae bacterium]|jgi:hypothetical protein|nr:hypothetical protein [Syntrophobacteraceae bacterium]